MDNHFKKIALVTSWFGKELTGGAEQQAWQMATRLTKAGFDISILTTCARSFHHSWDKNYYKPGLTQESGLSVRRFKVGPRDVDQFNRVVSTLLSFKKENLTHDQAPISSHDEAIYLNHNIHSPDLLAYLSASIHQYDAFLFMPYLFPLAIKGVEITKEKSIIQPCLHDECYAYLNLIKKMFKTCSMIFFNSEGEKEIAEKIFGSFLLDKSFTVGEGIEMNHDFYSDNGKALIKGSYFLYLGKKCEEKNTHALLKYFDTFSKTHDSALKLVLAGQETLPFIPKSDQILDLGAVSEEKKWNLLKHCSFLINPSENESFSRVIYEAWQVKKPIMIHQGSQAMYRALIDSDHAGWAFKNEDDFVTLLSHVSKISDSELAVLGKKGFVYGKKIADWDAVIERYREGFQALQKRQIFLMERG